MKKLLLLFFLFCSLFAVAYKWFIPHPGYAPKVNSYGNAYNRIVTDSAQHIPNKAGMLTNDNDTTPQLFVFADSLRGYWNGNFWNFGHGNSGGGGGSGIDGTLAIGNTSNNKSLTMLDSAAQALVQVDPLDEFINIGGYNSSGQQSGVTIDGLGGQVGLSASNGITIGSPVPGSSALFTLRQRVDQGPFNTNLYWPKLNKVAGDTIATLQDVRVAGNLDAVLGLGDTAYQKDMILSWDSQSASFSAGFARRFFDVHPDSLTGVFDVGDVDGHGTALFVFMGGRSVGVRADSGFQIGSFGDSRFTQIRNRADLAGSGFVAKLYLPATGNAVDTAATLWDLRNGGGGGSTNGVGRDTITTITSGTSSTVPNGTNIVRFNSTTVLTYSLTLPTTWHSSNDLLIAFTSNGTITNGNNMVTLTVVNGSGQTLSQALSPDGLTYKAGEIIRYHLISTIDQRTN